MKEKSNKENFARRLRKAADKIGGQAELARRTGISKVSIGSYVTGKSDPSMSRLVKMSEAMDVDLQWLVLGENSPEYISKFSNKKTQRRESDNKIVISEKIQKTIEILESDTIYRTALAANIDAFHHAVQQDDEMRENKKELQAQQTIIKGLEARISSLEKLLSSVSASPGDYRKKTKDNAA